MGNVDPQELAKFSELAHRWWDEASEFRPLHEMNPLRLEWIDSLAGLPGKAVLDIGCGGGILAEAMANRAAQVTGIDLASKPLGVARLHALETGVENIEYLEVSAEDLAAQRPAAFDVVTCMEMLEHVPDPRSVVAALASLVRPGGHVFLSTINRTPRAYLHAVFGAEYVLRLLPRGTHTYEKFIRPSELAAWGKSAGLETLDVAGLDYDPFTRSARLAGDARVNYVAHLHRPAAAGTRA